MTAAGVVLLTISLACIAPTLYGRLALVHQGAACESKESEDVQVECWMNIVLDTLKKDGIVSAYHVFAYLYETFPDFGATSCHLHAHRIGDAAYYNYFIAQGMTFDEIELPQETTSCGYGFFHGFIEHLIQDHPQPAYVTKTCEYLRKRLSGTMHDIGTICYHASGHGFSISKADHMQKGDWGNLALLTQQPLLQCESLPNASDKEVEDCREGVFNVVSDWMTAQNYGLSFDFAHPFDGCDKMVSRWHYACYYEFGQKLRSVTGEDPVKAEAIARTITDPTLREMTFGVMIAGMMQVQAPRGAYKDSAVGCTKVADDLFQTCVFSTANGLMEHGSPQKEYEEVLRLCSDPVLDDREGQIICYQTLERRLSRFYPPSKKADICGMFPESLQVECNATP